LLYRYLLCSSSCHTPSWLINLSNHLLRRHKFLISRTSIHKPPWSLGRQITFHFVN
jgi:hypothetical protein